ncbi:MAG: hypothetical protein HC902_01160 [Calothrix sp. SM1_5_4]|nr:hypothetical protein [Calothrix sp. SM1_5_4]
MRSSQHADIARDEFCRPPASKASPLIKIDRSEASQDRIEGVGVAGFDRDQNETLRDMRVDAAAGRSLFPAGGALPFKRLTVNGIRESTATDQRTRLSQGSFKYISQIEFTTPPWRVGPAADIR